MVEIIVGIRHENCHQITVPKSKVRADAHLISAKTKKYSLWEVRKKRMPLVCTLNRELENKQLNNTVYPDVRHHGAS